MVKLYCPPGCGSNAGTVLASPPCQCPGAPAGP